MKIEQLEELKTRNLQLFNWLLETEKENANMRDRLEELVHEASKT